MKIVIPKLGKLTTSLIFGNLTIASIGDIGLTHKALIRNHLISIKLLIEQVRLNFFLSNNEIISSVVGSFSKDESEELKTIIQVNVLNSLILSINSMYEYLLILYYLSTFSITEITAIFPKMNVLKSTTKHFDNYNDNWQLGLFSLIYKNIAPKQKMNSRLEYENWFGKENVLGNNSLKIVDFNLLFNFISLQREFIQQSHVNVLKHFGSSVYRMNDEDDPVSKGFWNFPVDYLYNDSHKQSKIGERFDLLDVQTVIRLAEKSFSEQTNFLGIILDTYKVSL
ncbi:hypothetical protein IT418_02810 [bacterium]|nr:hypothetical protein [bacterium]